LEFLGLEPQLFAVGAVAGIGRIVTLHHRSYTSYQIIQHTAVLGRSVSEVAMRPNPPRRRAAGQGTAPWSSAGAGAFTTLELTTKQTVLNGKFDVLSIGCRLEKELVILRVDRPQD
jgi:hypothetical protein